MTRGHNCFRLSGRGPAGFFIEPARVMIGGRIVPFGIAMRAYHTIEECFVDYARSLSEAVWYPDLRNHADQLHHFVPELQRLIGIRDAKWPEKVLYLIRTYSLDKLDASGSAPTRPDPYVDTDVAGVLTPLPKRTPRRVDIRRAHGSSRRAVASTVAVLRGRWHGFPGRACGNDFSPSKRPAGLSACERPPNVGPGASAG
jgi:hypothetical protein